MKTKAKRAKNEHLSDASINREVEKFVLKKLRLHSAKNVNFFGARVDLDGKNENGFFEIYSRIGETKVGGKRKVITDAVKLFLAARHNKKKNKTIVFIDKSVQKQFTEGKSWHVKALRELGIKTKVINISKTLKAKVLNAKEKQGRGITRKG